MKKAKTVIKEILELERELYMFRRDEIEKAVDEMGIKWGDSNFIDSFYDGEYMRWDNGR